MPISWPSQAARISGPGSARTFDQTVAVEQHRVADVEYLDAYRKSGATAQRPAAGWFQIARIRIGLHHQRGRVSGRAVLEFARREFQGADTDGG